jgi:hypothetical protein
MLHRRSLPDTRAAALSGALLCGCLSPDARLDDFSERCGKDPDCLVQPIDLGPECAPPAAGELDGTYLFALGAVQPEYPLLFLTEATTTPAPAGGTFLTLGLQPLQASDRQTEVCEPLILEQLLIDERGEMNSRLPLIEVPGVANPISGSRIEAEPILRARFCAAPGGGALDFYCGFVEGQLLQPFELDIKGSTFSMQRVSLPYMKPDSIVVDCNGKPAVDEVPPRNYMGCDAE